MMLGLLIDVEEVRQSMVSGLSQFLRKQGIFKYERIKADSDVFGTTVWKQQPPRQVGRKHLFMKAFVRGNKNQLEVKC